MDHTMQKNICKTIISGKEQNFNKQMAGFGVSVLFQYFQYSAVTLIIQSLVT